MLIDPQDLAVIGLLVFLEGILSIDNALVLAILARRVPEIDQKRALAYGVVGAVVLRIVALFMVSLIIKWTWMKFLGGGYLIWIAAQHWIKGAQSEEKEGGKKESFWKIVVLMIFMDLAFAVDSILAAFGVSKKLWVIITGALIGLVLIRFAAVVFIKLIKRFPHLEVTAYLLIFIIGVKLVLEGFHFSWLNFHSTTHWSFWTFWVLMAAAIALGFRKAPVKKTS
jgi:YkoY family integral membrane protein